MPTVPIICVRDVEATSKLLQQLFAWQSKHGGSAFDDLADASGKSVLWLHDIDTEDHPRFRGSDSKPLGVGLAIYVLVTDLDDTYESCQKLGLRIVETMHLNPNSKFREFTFAIADGYHFSVCEQGPYLNI